MIARANAMQGKICLKKRSANAKGDLVTYPVVLTMEGVQNGAYKSRETIEASFRALASAKLTDSHMHDSRGNMRRAVSNKEVIGYTSDHKLIEIGPPKAGEKKRLAIYGKANFRLPEAQKVIEEIDSGGRTDVSIMYMTSVFNRGGTFDGQVYNEEETDVFIDDLAILRPGETGACSSDDGCGIAGNQSNSNHAQGSASNAEARGDGTEQEGEQMTDPKDEAPAPEDSEDEHTTPPTEDENPLEAEVAKLKEENNGLKKQVEAFEAKAVANAEMEKRLKVLEKANAAHEEEKRLAKMNELVELTGEDEAFAAFNTEELERAIFIAKKAGVGNGSHRLNPAGKGNQSPGQVGGCAPRRWDPIKQDFVEA